MEKNFARNSVINGIMANKLEGHWAVEAICLEDEAHSQQQKPLRGQLLYGTQGGNA